jgi:hypothetical protein
MKDLNQETAKTVGDFSQGQAQAEQAAKNDPGAVGTVKEPAGTPPDISGKPKGL